MRAFLQSLVWTSLGKEAGASVHYVNMEEVVKREGNKRFIEAQQRWGGRTLVTQLISKVEIFYIKQY